MAKNPVLFLFEWACICTFVLVLCLYTVTVVTTACVVCVVILPFKGTRFVQKVCMLVADTYWGTLVLLIEKWGRGKVHISGDKIPATENAIIIANHRWFLDWLMFFCLAVRKGMLGAAKLFAKASIRWIPGFGWGMWVMDFPFLYRNWADDVTMINKTFHKLQTRKFPFWLISHLEGTRITDKKVRESQEFAKKKDLPILKNVLLPRKKGFFATMKGLRNSVSAVYDFTVVYGDGSEYRPALGDVVMRRGFDIHLHVRRYPIKEVPVEEAKLEQWLNNVWEEKDKAVDYLLKNGKFPSQQDEPYRHVPLVLE